MSNNIVSVTEQDYPTLYRAADEASLSSQKWFVWLSATNLICGLLGSTIATTSGLFPENKHLLLIIAGVLLFFGGLGLSFGLRILKPDATWFGARFVAESTKTISWRYMMGIDPMPMTLSPEQVDLKFCDLLREILEQKKTLAFAFVGSVGNNDQITETMRRVRNESVDNKKAIYLKNRISEEKVWYSTKASTNKKWANVTSIGIIIIQLFAFLALVAVVYEPIWLKIGQINLTGVFITLAASLTAWTQIRRYRELAQAYSISAFELSLIESKAMHVKTDAELAGFIADSEKAISKEHSLWVSRRDHS